jgi:hypothetical protein
METIKLIFPMPTYPWTAPVSPFARRDFYEEREWYDTDYTFLSPKAREKYKQHGLSQVTVWMLPTVTEWHRIMPVTRYLIYHTVFDDYFENCPVDKLYGIRDHFIDVVLGAKPHQNDIGLFRQIAKTTEEIRALGAPDFWFDRLAHSFYKYITYGIIEEAVYKVAEKKRFPSLVHYMHIHEFTVGMCPYVDMIEPATDCYLPPEVFKHPIIQRLVVLMNRIIAVQNDVSSLAREMSRGSLEMMNLILIIQHENKISLEEAYQEAMKIHYTDVAEFHAIHKALPDFGPNHPIFGPHLKAIDHYITHYEYMIAGINQWYQFGDSVRYNDIGGYPDPGSKYDNILG